MIERFLVLVLMAMLFPSCLLTPLSNSDQTSRLENTLDSDDVKDLESLRTSVSNKANNNESGKPETSEPLPTPLPQSDGPQPNSRSAIFRHRGITEAKKSYWADKMPQVSSSYKNVGIEYSPTELAMYVYNTGDEEGVAVAVEELVREGLMGRTDAINYLQDVKQILSFLRNQCSHPKPEDEFKSQIYSKPDMTQRMPSPPREQFLPVMELNKRESKPLAPVVTTDTPHEAVIASTSEPKGSVHSASTTTGPQEAPKEDDFQDVKRRVPQKDTFALQVVYRLAKEMFTKSILRGNPTAVDTLSGLVDFLEMEVGNNRISPEMKEKVLELVSTALVDSLREYQDFLQLNQVPEYDNGLYMHESKPSKSSAAEVPISNILRKLPADHENMLQLPSKNNRPNSS